MLKVIRAFMRRLANIKITKINIASAAGWARTKQEKVRDIVSDFFFYSVAVWEGARLDFRFVRTGGLAMLRMMGGSPEAAHDHSADAGHGMAAQSVDPHHGPHH